MRKTKETLRLTALVAAITLGLCVQNLASPGGRWDPRAALDLPEQQPHWLASPVRVETLAPYLG